MVPMQEALADLDLPASVAQSQLTRGGEYGPYLQLAEACEDPSLEGVAALCQQLDIAPKALSLAQMQAADWVNRLGI